MGPSAALLLPSLFMFQKSGGRPVTFRTGV
jgi:hypothetical protein